MAKGNNLIFNIISSPENAKKTPVPTAIKKSVNPIILNIQNDALCSLKQ